MVTQKDAQWRLFPLSFCFFVFFFFLAGRFFFAIFIPHFIKFHYTKKSEGTKVLFQSLVVSFISMKEYSF